MNLPPKIQEYAFYLLKRKNNLFYRKQVIRNFDQNRQSIPLDKIIQYQENRPYGYQRFLCNAPFTSLYFGVQGQVIACCKNRKKILGNINEKSIEAIWNGKEAQELRDAIKNNQLELGCHDCQNGILAENYASVMALSYDNLQANETLPFPKRMDFELSSTCNLACVMCTGYLSSTYRKHVEQAAPYPEAYDARFLLQLEPFIPHLRKANFFGGEPFLIDLYYPIWDMLLKKNRSCTIFIQTNGLILNNRVKNLLESGNFHLGVSLESLQEKSYESVRLFGQYKKLVQNLAYFRDYCRRKRTQLSLAITPLRHTIDELPDFVHFANSLDTPLYFNILTEPHNLSLWALSAEELNNLHHRLSTTELPAGSSVERSNRNQYYAYLNQMGHWMKEAGEREGRLAEMRSHSTGELHDILLKKLDNYIRISGLGESEKAAEVREQTSDKLSKLADQDPQGFREKLAFYCTLPDDRFVHEFIMHG